MDEKDVINIIATKLGRLSREGSTPRSGEIVYRLENAHVVELYISYCNLTIKTIPDELFQLVNLKRLDLSLNQLVSVPPLITKFKQLEYLNLSFNHISRLPTTFNKLLNMVELNLSDNYLETLPLSFFSLSNLKKLRLNGNKIKDFPYIDDNFNIFPELESIDLDNAAFSELPKWILRLPKLRFLSLTHIRFTRFPIELSKVDTLEELYLDSTEFPAWPATFRLPRKLSLLVLDGATLDAIPRSIVEEKPVYIINQRNKRKNINRLQVSIGNLFPSLDSSQLLSNDPEISYNYLVSLRDNYNANGFNKTYLARLTDVKVVVLGAGATGKTSLIQRLCASNPDDSSTPLFEEVSTNGVDSSHSAILLDVLLDNTLLGNITLHFWDFGGQEQYQSLNRLLLTDNCIYIIVLDSRANTKVDIWLDFIAQYAPNSDIIIVSNKLDECPHTHINFNALASRNNNIWNKHYKISCKYPDRGIDNISDILSSIKKILQNKTNRYLPIWQREQIAVRTQIQNIFNDESHSFITLPQFNEICKRNGIIKENEQHYLLSLLFTSGYCIYFNGNEKILNPNWIIECLYVVYALPSCEKGLMLYSKFKERIAQISTVADSPEIIVNILTARQLCIRLKGFGEEWIFCPFLLPETADLPAYLFRDETFGIIFEFRFYTIPDLEFQMLSVRLTKLQEMFSIKKIWQYGIWIKRTDGLEAVIEYKSKSIYLKVLVKNGIGFMQIGSIYKTINELFEGESNCAFEKYIVISESVQYGQQQNKKAILAFDTLEQLFISGFKQYLFADIYRPELLLLVDIQYLGYICGIEPKKFNSKPCKYQILDQPGGKTMIVSGDYIGYLEIRQGDYIKGNKYVYKFPENKIIELSQIANQLKDCDEQYSELKGIINDLKNVLDATEKESLSKRFQSWLSAASNIATISDAVKNVYEILKDFL